MATTATGTGTTTVVVACRTGIGAFAGLAGTGATDAEAMANGAAFEGNGTDAPAGRTKGLAGKRERNLLSECHTVGDMGEKRVSPLLKKIVAVRQEKFVRRRLDTPFPPPPPCVL